MRLFVTLATVLVACGLAACGDDPPASPAGSAANPLPAATAEPGAAREPGSAAGGGEQDASTAEPGFKALVDAQTRHPRERFTPCNLVTAGEARAILGGPIADPVEAPQGPTCIYRTKSGDAFVTLAVQPARFATLRRQMSDVRAVDVADRAAVCGTHGQAMLYLDLDQGRVLAVSGSCTVARRFAERAVRELTA